MTENSCTYCPKQNLESGKMISFEHLGFFVRIFKTKLECEDCAKNRWIKKFEDSDVKEFIIFRKVGKPTINWTEYALKLFYGSGGHDKKREIKANDIFRELGVLSFMPQGNWELAADGFDGEICLNPSDGTYRLYFVSKDDAIRYGRLCFDDGRYWPCGEWRIRRIRKV